MSEKQNKLRVIIVGGSIAGLTLAHCLQHLDIDFVILEAHKEIAPQIGASIVILPSGARILDQLGIWNDVLATIDPLMSTLTWTEDGKMLVESDSAQLVASRSGYDLAFLTRKELLSILYRHIPDKSKVLTSKRVVDIENSDTGVTVRCEDGSVFEGDIVAGADGIHSKVRNLMQQHMEKIAPGSLASDAEAISAEYSCIFGFGDAVNGGKGVNVGESHRTYTKDYSTLSFVGKGKLYWFLFSKLDKRYYGKEIPKYTQDDVEEAMKAFYKLPMTDTINYQQVWEQRTFANMVCVEEMKLKNWTSDRFVILGDSAHKMTPNLGAGGNAAIESAVTLANNLAKLPSAPSMADIRQTLKNFHSQRKIRIDAICDAANDLTRIEAISDLPHKITALYAIPNLGDWLTDVTTDALVGAEKFDALPLPAKSLKATMPWDPKKGLGKNEKKWKRALWALPLLLVLFASKRTMGTSISQLKPALKAAMEAGKFTFDNGETASLATKFFGIAAIDRFLKIFVSVFTPGLGNLDPAGRMQAIAFLADLVPMQGIWMVESIRRGNFLSATHLLPLVYGILYQNFGIGFVAPIYYFLHYVELPIEKYHAADNRMTLMGPVKAILPTIAITYVLPTLGMMFAPGLSNRQWINGVFWQPFPLYAALVQRLLSTYLVKDSTSYDRIHNAQADMPYLRKIYAITATTSALAYLYVRVASPVSMFDIFFKGTSNPKATIGLVQEITRFLRYDQIMAFGAGAIWTMLSFKDLKKEKKISAGWAKIVGVFTGTTLLAGPGAAMAAMWAWREEALAGNLTRLRILD